MVNKYSTRLNFLKNVAVDNFMKTRLDKMVVIQMESRQIKMKSEKVEAGYIKQIKHTLALSRRKKKLQNIKNLGELLCIQEIRRTEGNLGEPRNYRKTWTICIREFN